MDALAYPLPAETRASAVLAGDGGTDYGPLSFKIFDTADVHVWVRPSGSDFWGEVAATVTKTSGDDYDTFSVSLASAITAADSYVVVSARVHERLISATRGGAISAVALELELSKQGSVLEELRRDMDRALQMPWGTDGPLQLPAMGDTETIVWDAANGRFSRGPTTSQIAGAEASATAAAGSATSAAASASAAAGSASSAAASALSIGFEAVAGGSNFIGGKMGIANAAPDAELDVGGTVKGTALRTAYAKIYDDAELSKNSFSAYAVRLKTLGTQADFSDARAPFQSSLNANPSDLDDLNVVNGGVPAGSDDQTILRGDFLQIVSGAVGRIDRAIIGVTVFDPTHNRIGAITVTSEPSPYPANIAPVKITGVADNGSGAFRITAVAHGLATGALAPICNSALAALDQFWTVTRIDADTVDLVDATSGAASVYAAGWAAGGTLGGILCRINGQTNIASGQTPFDNMFFTASSDGTGTLANFYNEAGDAFSDAAGTNLGPTMPASGDGPSEWNGIAPYVVIDAPFLSARNAAGNAEIRLEIGPQVEWIRDLPTIGADNAQVVPANGSVLADHFNTCLTAAATPQSYCNWIVQVGDNDDDVPVGQFDIAMPATRAWGFSQNLATSIRFEQGVYFPDIPGVTSYGMANDGWGHLSFPYLNALQLRLRNTAGTPDYWRLVVDAFTAGDGWLGFATGATSGTVPIAFSQGGATRLPALGAASGAGLLGIDASGNLDVQSAGPTACTPSDASGDGIEFTAASAHHVQTGKRVDVFFSLQWPSTAGTANVAVAFAGLPARSAAPLDGAFTGAVGYTTLATLPTLVLNAATQLNLYTYGSSATLLKNSGLSTQFLRGMFSYYTD